MFRDIAQIHLKQRAQASADLNALLSILRRGFWGRMKWVFRGL